jgi:hypothetical protein
VTAGGGGGVVYIYCVATIVMGSTHLTQTIYIYIYHQPPVRVRVLHSNIGDIDRWKSTMIVFFFGSSSVAWQSQKMVLLLTCEADYIIVLTTVCQGVWLR